MWMMCLAWIKGNYMTIAVLALTCLCAAYDMQKKEIPIWPVWIGIILAVVVWICRIFTGEAEFTEMIFAVLPGLFLLVIGFFSKEKVGFGDGILLIMIGLMVGFSFCLGILCVGLMSACLYALFLLIFRRAGRGDSFPFVPFLALAVGVCMIV